MIENGYLITSSQPVDMSTLNKADFVRTANRFIMNRVKVSFNVRAVLVKSMDGLIGWPGHLSSPIIQVYLFWDDVIANINMG